MITNIEQTDDFGVREIKLTAAKHVDDERELLAYLDKIFSSGNSDFTLTIRVTDGIITSELIGTDHG